MKEIGGYMEFEHYHGEMLHDNAIKLNSGRSCLAYLIIAKQIKKIAIPYFLCDCIEDTCKKYGVHIHYYHIGYDFLPIDVQIENDEWLYLVNYYGQLSRDTIKEYKNKYERVILDNAHAYFEDPIPGIDTLYTCRKYFGVTDGGILYTDKKIDVNEQDESYNRLRFLAGRLENTGSEFFEEYQENEEWFYGESVKIMSKFTSNVLRSLDYKMILNRRRENMEKLHERFGSVNKLRVDVTRASFMYPLMIDNADQLRNNLIKNRIYIPKLWPNVENESEISELELEYTLNILPIPVDQRYSIDDMDYIINTIELQGVTSNEIRRIY